VKKVKSESDYFSRSNVWAHNHAILKTSRRNRNFICDRLLSQITQRGQRGVRSGDRLPQTGRLPGVPVRARLAPDDGVPRVRGRPVHGRGARVRGDTSRVVP